MLARFRPHSAYDVMAAIAFFVVVAGGSAYAAATIGSGDIKKNAVLSKHIKNGQVKNADLGPSSVGAGQVKDAAITNRKLAQNSVGTTKVINGSLLAQDFKPGQLPSGPPTSILTGVVTTSNGGIHFGAPSGASSASATESDVQTLTPAGASITARDLSLSWPSGYILPSGWIASITLRVNGADTVLSCLLPDGGTACHDSSHAVTIPPNSRVDVKVSVAGSGAFGTTPWEFGWRAVP